MQMLTYNSSLPARNNPPNLQCDPKGVTASSSAVVLQFTPPTASTTPPLPRFEAWRETWHRQVLKDPNCKSAANKVAGFVIWHLNRESRSCFLLLGTIATGTAMSPRNAIRGIQQLIERRHLRRESRPGKSNLFFPLIAGQGGDRFVTPGVTGLSPLPVTGSSPITSESLTSEINRSRSALGENAANTRNIQTESAERTSTSLPSGTQKKQCRFAFEGQVVRLTAPDLERWQKSYSLIDVLAQLQVADDWYGTHPPPDGQWFHRVSRWLAQENDKQRKQREADELDEDSF